MKVLGKMGNSAIRSSSLEYYFIQRVWETVANMLFDGCCCHVYRRFIPKCNFGFVKFILTQISYFEYFMLPCFRCFRFNFEMFKILLYKVYMLKYREKVCMSFCKDTEKMAFLYTNPLNFCPLPSLKRKKNAWMFGRDIPNLKNSKLEKVFHLLILVLWIYFYNFL